MVTLMVNLKQNGNTLHDHVNFYVTFHFLLFSLVLVMHDKLCDKCLTLVEMINGCGKEKVVFLVAPESQVGLKVDANQ